MVCSCGLKTPLGEMWLCPRASVGHARTPSDWTAARSSRLTRLPLAASPNPNSTNQAANQPRPNNTFNSEERDLFFQTARHTGSTRRNRRRLHGKHGPFSMRGNAPSSAAGHVWPPPASSLVGRPPRALRAKHDQSPARREGSGGWPRAASTRGGEGGSSSRVGMRAAANSSSSRSVARSSSSGSRSSQPSSMAAGRGFQGLQSVLSLCAFGLLEPKHCLGALGPAGRASSVSRVAPGGPQCAAAQAGNVSRRRRRQGGDVRSIVFPQCNAV